MVEIRETPPVSTAFRLFEYNGETQFPSVLVDYGNRTHSVYFRTEGGFTVSEVDRRNGNKVTPFEYEGMPPAGFLIMGSRQSNDMYLFPLREAEIRQNGSPEEVSVALGKKGESLAKSVDIEPYAVVKLNPDTQSVSVFHSKRSMSPPDFHVGGYVDEALRNNLTIPPDGKDGDGSDVARLPGSKQPRGHYTPVTFQNGAFKHTPKERTDIRKKYELGKIRMKGTQRPDHHGFNSDYDNDWGKISTMEEREKRDKHLAMVDSKDALDHPPEKLAAPKKIYFGSFNGSVPKQRRPPPEPQWIDPTPPASPMLTGSERGQIARENKIRNFGRGR